MANTNLTQAKNAKNDEFYTQYYYIEKEINAYLEYSPETFKDKIILLPCDDPEWSNFTKYFAQNFKKLGLKKLISTSYAIESKAYKKGFSTTSFEKKSPQFDKKKTRINGKIFTLTKDKNKDGKIDLDDLDWEYMEGDGDFRSEEVKKLRDEADIIITNPPFSLFREFLAWVVESKNKFVIIGNMNAITYKEVFPLIKENKIWLGDNKNGKGNSMTFKNINQIDVDIASKWFTNIDHGRRHQELPLMTTDENLKYSKHKKIKDKESYDKYENYDAIEIPFTDSIPSDYRGIMGVPISFLDKYNPEQFEIVGMCENKDLYKLRIKTYTTLECKEAYLKKFGKNGTYDLNASGVIIKKGKREKVYQRILIKHKK
jgi:hypothetical protein